MGQQQLLLIVLGIIIVGIALIIGIALFRSHAIEAKRNNVINDCLNLAAMAQQHFRKPTTLGGGDKAFNASNGGVAWSIPENLVTTSNGHYRITDLQKLQLTINAVGNEVVTDSDTIEVNITIRQNDYTVSIVH